MADEIINYEQDFEAIVKIIETAKLRAMKAVNTELIDMYLQIGKYISEKTALFLGRKSYEHCNISN